MKLAPYQYIHVLNKNQNLTRIIEGPQNFVLQEHEEIITGHNPKEHIILEPNHYALIVNPVIRKGKERSLVFDRHGQVKVRNGEMEIRTDTEYPEPFPLYPGEKLKTVDKLTVIPRGWALKVKANRNFVQPDKTKRLAGDEWQIMGPCIYVPRIEEDKIQLQQPIILEVNKAIKLRARYACVDSAGVKRQAGEEWLIRTPGSYLLGVNEILIEIVQGIILTDKKALCLTALRNFKDVYGIERKAGEEWLITNAQTSVHICDVHEKVVSEVPISILRNDEYTYLLNPRVNKVNEMGKKILMQGPHSFFLQPGEMLDGGIKKNYVLADDEALLLTAKEDFVEGQKKDAKKHTSGERWMIHGPCSFVPRVEVGVLEMRQAIPMDILEGIYIRNINTGNVRAHIGKTYMLNEHEELANKPCSSVVNELMEQQANIVRKQNYKLITFNCPFNAAVQIYDYRKKKSRVVFGPDSVSLGPDEQFTVTYLSGSTPKQPGHVKTLYLMLGPNFATDIAEVETSDHARLEIKMSLNWRFVVSKAKPELMFNVRDFIGDMCKAMGSRVRSHVASIPFDSFHKSSYNVIRRAIFGVDPTTGKLNESVFFESNGLEIFNVDVQSIEPTDKKTKDSLNKTVTQAIQITTKMQEQDARREADKIEQEERAKLDCLILDNKTQVEKAKQAFLQLKAESDSIKSKGQAIAEAKAKAEAAEISAKAEVTFAELKSKARMIRENADIEHEREKNLIEFSHQKALSEIKIKEAQELSTIESDKFKSIMNAMGQSTLVDIANAGPETQAKMLGSLGLQGYMLMGSENPINLFTAANGMLSPEQEKKP